MSVEKEKTATKRSRQTGKAQSLSKKRTAKRSRAKQPLPEILLIGNKKRMMAINNSFDRMSVSRRLLSWPLDWDNAIGPHTIAVVLVSPLSEKNRNKVADVTKFIRKWKDCESLSVIGIVPNNTTDKEVRAIYSASASAVFKWPSESKDLPNMIAEILGMSQARGKAGSADKALARTIRAHFKTQNIHTGGLKVTVKDGAAEIHGAVGSLWQKIQIIKLVEQIPGITAVTSGNFRVSHSGISDKRVSESVKHVLKATTDIEESTIATNVQNGVVTLSGTTADKREYNRIINILSHVNGVRGIDKYAIISTKRKKRDKTLAAEIKKTLAFSFPEVHLKLNVFGGAVVLSGQTDTLAKRREIVETVELFDGVDHVVNKIKVK